MTSDEPTRTEPAGQLPGELLADISRAMVTLYKECYGRGPTKARTVIDDDLVVCVLEGGFTAGERTLTNAGRQDTVSESREAFQEVMRRRFVEVVEELTGRKVRAFLSAVDPDAEIASEQFMLEPFRDDEEQAIRAWAEQTRRQSRVLREQQVVLRTRQAELRRQSSERR